MLRFPLLDPQHRPETYLQSALQSLGRITNTLNRSAVKYDISPTKPKPLPQSPRQKFQLDQNSLSNILQQTQRCQKILSEIMGNPTPTPQPYSKYIPHKTNKTHKLQANQNKQQALVNQVFEKLVNSGYLPSPPHPHLNSPYKSMKSSSIHSSPDYLSETHMNQINNLIQRLNMTTTQNQHLKKRVESLELMLVDKELSEMNEQIKSVIESGDDSLVKELAGLRMEKARMNQEFEREIKKYNEVFRRMKMESGAGGDGNGNGEGGMMEELVEENSRLLREKEEDQRVIEELRGKVMAKHRHMRNLSRTMSKLCFNS